MGNRVLTAVGIIFHAIDTDRYLYLMRNDTKNPYCWGLPGGKVNDGESLMDAITRECVEELGTMPTCEKIAPIEQFTSDNELFHYHTFVGMIPHEFIPSLNDEHLGYMWLSKSNTPKPLHPGLWATFNIDDVFEKLSNMSHLYGSSVSV